MKCANIYIRQNKSQNNRKRKREKEEKKKKKRKEKCRCEKGDLVRRGKTRRTHDHGRERRCSYFHELELQGGGGLRAEGALGLGTRDHQEPGARDKVLGARGKCQGARGERARDTGMPEGTPAQGGGREEC